MRRRGPAGDDALDGGDDAVGVDAMGGLDGEGIAGELALLRIASVTHREVSPVDDLESPPLDGTPLSAGSLSARST